MIRQLWQRFWDIVMGSRPRANAVEGAIPSKPGARLTEREAGHIAGALKDGRPLCPDCKKGDFLLGPQGCGSVNVRCDLCGAEFDLYVIPEDDFVIGERLEPR